ncbi:MAG: lactate racemase domain-containing protein [Candidatus Bathyarchaeota archaeon]|jgi:nickel-dependent lactate racemase
MVEVWLPYGKTEVHVSIPLKYLVGTIEPAVREISPNPFETVVEALRTPLDTKVLQETVEPGNKVAIALDSTMDPFLASLSAAGIAWTLNHMEVPSEDIKIIVGNGLREGSDPLMLGALQEADALKGIEILEHDRGSGNVASIGATSGGTEVELSTPFIEADARIAVGEVIPDHFAGIKGAQSTVLPSLASFKTLEQHKEGAFQGDILPGQYRGNPVHADQIEACEMVGITMALQLVTDGRGSLVSAFSGSLDSSLEKAVEALGDSYRAPFEGEADIVVVSAGGDRFDFDLYNAIWALKAVTPMVKNGGTIIFCAECQDGLGAEGLDTLALVDTLAELRRRYMLGAGAVYTIKSSLRNNEVIMVSALPDYLAEPLGLTVKRAANEAFQKTLQRKRGRQTLVVTHGCSIVPVKHLEGEEGD